MSLSPAWRRCRDKLQVLAHPSSRRAFSAVAAVLTVVVCFKAPGYEGGSDFWVYLLPARLAIDTGFLANDWYAQSTTPYHFTFQGFVAAFWQRGRLSEGLLLWHLASTIVLVWALYRWARLLGGSAMSLLVIAALLVSGVQRGWGDEPLLFPRAAPSAFGIALAMLALWATAARRPWVAVGLLACTLYVHVNVGMWAVLMAGAVVLSRIDAWWWRRDLWLAFALLIAVAAPLVLTVSAPFGGGAEPADFVALFYGRSPHHYAPIFAPTATHVTSLFLVALGLGAALLSGEHRRELTALWLVVAAGLLGGFVFLRTWTWPFFVQLYPFRMLTMLTLVTFAALAARLVGGSARQRVAASAWILAALLFAHWPRLALAVALVVPVVALRLPARLRPLLVTASAAAVLAGCFLAFRAGLVGRGVDLEPFPEPPGVSFASIAWVVPTDGVIMVPPSLEWMRLGVGRAVAIDVKGMPLAPVEIHEWRRRIELITGIDPGEADVWYPPVAPAPLEPIYDRAYAERSLAELASAAADLRADYLMVATDSVFSTEARRLDLAPLWGNNRLAIYARASLPR